MSNDHFNYQREMELIRTIPQRGPPVEHKETRESGVNEVFAGRGELQRKAAGDIGDGDRSGRGWLRAQLDSREWDCKPVFIQDLPGYGHFGRG